MQLNMAQCHSPFHCRLCPTGRDSVFIIGELWSRKINRSCCISNTHHSCLNCGCCYRSCPSHIYKRKKEGKIMEPLGSAASIFAVVSLAFQLAQSTKEFKRALDAVHNASAEATRLRNVVLQLHCVTASVQHTLEHQNGMDSSDDYISNIHFALNFCEREFGAMRAVLRIAEKVDTEKNSVSRLWASIRLAYTSDQIEKLATRLERAMSFLNASLLLNLT
jgi:hypothetical protein